MSNANHITQGGLDHLCGIKGAPHIEAPSLEAPSLEDATALIRKLTLTPENCMTLLNVIATRLVEPCQGMTLAQLNRDPRMQACALIDSAADEISNIDGVTV